MAADQAAPHVILSLGAGVQSTTLALMAARGDLPLPAAAIFADTGWESAATYAHLAWLTQTLDGRLPVHVVRKARRDGTAAHIRDDALAVVAGRLSRMATPPVFVKGSHEYNPCPNPAQQAKLVRHVGGAATFVVMPLFARTFTCKTSQLKRRGARRTQPPFVEMRIGISADEKATRCNAANPAASRGSPIAGPCASWA